MTPLGSVTAPQVNGTGCFGLNLSAGKTSLGAAGGVESMKNGKSLVVVPSLTWIVWGPEGAVGTLKVAVKLPAESALTMATVTGALSKVTVMTPLGAKPVPV